MDDDHFQLVMDNALVPSPMGSVDGGFDPYNNAVVYFFAFLGLLFVFLGLVAVVVAGYRVARHRPNARRGLVVASIAFLIGIGTTVTILASM